MENFRKEKLGNTNALFESMYDYAKILYRLYNELAKLEEQTTAYNDCLEKIKLVIYSENKLYQNKSDEVISRLLQYLSNDEKFFKKGKSFKDDGFYLINNEEHPLNYYALRRVFNRLKIAYLDRASVVPNSIESLGIKSLIKEEVVINDQKRYIIYDRKNECERLLMIADYINMFHYYNSLKEADENDKLFSIHKNLLLLINPYLESKILFEEDQFIINPKNVDFLEEYILPMINKETMKEIFQNLRVYDDEVVKNKTESMNMKLLILRIDSICTNSPVADLRKRLEDLALGDVQARIMGTPRKRKIITEIRKYLIEKR